MWLLTAIAPVLIVGGIVLYVIGRLKHKYNNGTLGKKKSKNAQILLDSFIPMGMLVGCIIGLNFRHVFPGLFTSCSEFRSWNRLFIWIFCL